MRKLLKIVLGVLAVLIVLVAGFGGFAYLKSQAALKKTYAVTVRSIAIPTDAAALAHGRHLVETRGCIDCHGRDLGSGVVADDPAMGRLYAPNLTRGKGGSIAAFTDEDWVRAIRYGVGKDGRGLFIMPSLEYSHLSDEDLGAIIAFAKTVPAVDRAPVPTRYGPVSRVLLATSPAKMIAAEELSRAPVAAPAAILKAPTVEYGRYLAAACVGCHGPNFSGGKIEIGPPDWPMAANLTPHPDSRLAKWTEEEFIATIRTARRPDGTELDPAMPRGFGGMDEVELKALWAFLKTLPPAAQGVR